MPVSNPIATDRQVLYVGDSHPIVVEIPDAAGVLASGVAQVRDGRGALVYELELDADQEAGEIAGEVPSEETETWEPGQYSIGVRATYTTGSVLTVAEVTLYVRRGPVR